MVNRDPERDAETTILLTDAAFEESVPAHEATGPEPVAKNDFGEERVGVSERFLAAMGPISMYAFPACSVTILSAGLAG